MQHELEAIQELADRVRRGDSAAERELARALGPTLEAMARRTLRDRSVDSPFDERVHAEAETMPGEDAPGGRDRVAREAARRICETMIDRLRSGLHVRRPMVDTVLI